MASILRMMSQGSMTGSHAATTWLKDHMLLRKPMYACMPQQLKSKHAHNKALRHCMQVICLQDTHQGTIPSQHSSCQASLPLASRAVQQHRGVLDTTRQSMKALLDSVHSSVTVPVHCCHVAYVCMCIGRAQYLGNTFGEAAQAGLDAAQLQLGQGPPESIPEQHAGGSRLHHHVHARCLQPDMHWPDW